MNSTFIDDQDPQVTYVGNWILGGSDKEYNGTVTSTTSVNDSFTVAFKGTSVSVYGTVDSTSGGVVTNYTVDGVPTDQVTSMAGAGDAYDQLFWASPTLASGDHQLLVKMIKINPDPQGGEGTIWFDYFYVTQGPLTSPSAASPSPSITPSGATTGKKSHKIGPIVGIVCGIIILIVLVVLLLYRRRRRISKDVGQVRPLAEHFVVPDPFPVTRNTNLEPNRCAVTLVPRSPMDYTRGNGSSHFTPFPFSPPFATSAFVANGQFHRGGKIYSLNPSHDALLNGNRRAPENAARTHAMFSLERLQHADSRPRAIDSASRPPGGGVEPPPGGGVEPPPGGGVDPLPGGGVEPPPAYTQFDH